MADITLKNLGDIPVVEPNESTHLLAEQDGAYARLPKDKVGGGALNVVIEMANGENDLVYSCDTPHTDIVEALSAKKHVSIVLVDFNVGGDTVMQMYTLKKLELETDGVINMSFENGYMVKFNADGTISTNEPS